MSENKSILDNISVRARFTYMAHLFKACTKQHHKNLIPSLSNIIPKDGIVIEAGSHAGQFTKLFSHLAPQGHIYAVEPNSYAYSILRCAIKFNQIKNVSIERLGFSNEPGELVLSMPVKKSGSYGFGLSSFGHCKTDDSRKYLTERVPVTTVDAFVQEKGITNKLDLLKADIEGWEMRFLLGAIQTIDSFKPAILLEMDESHLNKAGNTCNEVWEFLSNRGYRGYTISEELQPCSYGLSGIDVLFIFGTLSQI